MISPQRSSATEPGPDPGEADAPDGPAGAGASGGLASQALRGASFLFGREAIGSVVRLAGVIIAVRAIGPSGYGIFTAAAAFVAVVVTIAQMGAEVYLIRVHETPSKRLNNEVFSLLLCTSLGAMIVSEALTFPLAPLLRPVGVLLPLRVLLLCIPINVLWAPAQAHIERRFDYKKMGILELGGDVVLYATAIPLALLHFGAWSLVAGYFAWQTYLLVGSLLLSGLRPRWSWSFATARRVARHGLSYSTASLCSNMANLISAMVVGTFAGAAGVGYVSFARNLVTTVGFAQRCAYRLGIVTMAQIRRDRPERFREGLERGAFVLTLALAIPFAAFGLAAHWIIPGVFGHEWAAAIPVYCLLALAQVLASIPQIEASLFYALGRNGTVAAAYVLQTVLLAVLSIGLVKVWGVTGFGVATVLALAGYLLMHVQTRRLSTVSYRLTVLAALATVPSLFLPWLPPPLGLVLLVPWVAFLVPPLRTAVGDLWRTGLASLRAGPR